MKILMVTAMEEELLPIIKNLEFEVINSDFPNKVYKEFSKLNELYFSHVGIGKVNASISITSLIKEINPDLIINFGTAGGLNEEVNILDIIIGTSLAYHDVDVTGFGYKIGQIPGEKLYFSIDIPPKLLKFLDLNDIRYKQGLILSGDQFISDKNVQQKLLENFPTALAVEMESTAIVNTCKKFGTEVLVFRGISDLAHEKSTIEFNEYLEKVVIKFQKIVEIFQSYE